MQVASSTFVPPGNRARWAMVFLAATIVVDVVAIESDFWQISAINAFLDGRETSIGPLLASDDRQSVVGWLEIAVGVATAILFIRWFHAAYRNIASLGMSDLRFKPGWAIGGWFVPFLNLWRPKQIANDIWRASDPEAPLIEGASSSPRSRTGLLTLWWLCWLMAFFIGRSSISALLHADTLAEIRKSAELDIAASGFHIAAAVLAILVIHRVSSRQLSKAQLLAAQG